MFVLIIVIHYYMVCGPCLITVSIHCRLQKRMNNAVHIFCRLPKFHYISDVLMDLCGLTVPYSYA